MTRLVFRLSISRTIRALVLFLSVAAHSLAGQDEPYTYATRRDFLTMPDGGRLAVTWWTPKPRTRGERFPALLELLPYRKDDSFYARDFPLYDYFARRGFLLAKVDIRGTGGSPGRVPPREYSEQELNDAAEIIAQLARHPSSNGNVGMWGISWGGFNAIQVALRRPPALRAIIALHASDDLFHDDVRYIDGGLHIDPYALQIDHENGLPRTPAYALDSAYFRDRFEAYPWVLTYLKQPVDGEFWRRNALRYRAEALDIPAYFIGGLLDGYRDTPIRALEYLTSPVKVEIGPWVHAWPDDGAPGPNYEWRSRAVRWWNHWLRGQDTGLLDEPRLLVYQRAGHGPDRTLAETPGAWRFEDWPVAGGRREEWRLAEAGRLVRAGAEELLASDSVALYYTPGSGVMAGDWWGEPTGDMRRDDAGSLVFDGPVLDQPVTVVGMPRVRLRFTAGAPLATWTARLEDVAPDGQVALVTGGAINAAHYRSTVSPARLVPGERHDLAWDLHFTTWTFRPGHRLRVAVSNAQFPMIWPTPYPMISRVSLGGSASSLDLPVVLDLGKYSAPVLPAPEPRAERADVTYHDGPASVERISYEPLTGLTTLEWSSPAAWTIGKVRYDYSEREIYRTFDKDPANSTFLGVATHRIRPPGRDILLETEIDIRSDTALFHVTVTRGLSLQGKLIRRKQWQEAIPRDFH